MHLFQWNTLLYLSFHLIGGALMLASALGIPGQLDDSKPSVKKIAAVFNASLVIAWSGIPLLFVAALACFYFSLNPLAQLLSITSLCMGLTVFISLICLYKAK